MAVARLSLRPGEWLDMLRFAPLRRAIALFLESQHMHYRRISLAPGVHLVPLLTVLRLRSSQT